MVNSCDYSSLDNQTPHRLTLPLPSRCPGCGWGAKKVGPPAAEASCVTQPMGFGNLGRRSAANAFARERRRS